MSQKLKRASQFTFGELNLRQFIFNKWRNFKNMSMATENIDVALLVWSLRDAMNEWKSLAWPRKHKSRRNLRVFKKGIFGQSQSMMIEGEFDEDIGEYVDKKHEYMWPQQDYFGNTITSTTSHNRSPIGHDDGHDLEMVGDQQQQDRWQMAALMGEGGDQEEEELEEEEKKSTTSKKSWFTFSSLRSRRR